MLEEQVLAAEALSEPDPDAVYDMVRDLHESIVAALIEAGMVTYAVRRRGAVTTLNASSPAHLWPRGEEFADDLLGGRSQWS